MEDGSERKNENEMKRIHVGLYGNRKRRDVKGREVLTSQPSGVWGTNDDR
jgi:hypothetical protein